MDLLDFYLNDPDQPIVPGFSRPRATGFAHGPSSKEYPPPAQSRQTPSSPTFSSASTVSTSTYNANNSLSRASTIGSGTSATTIPPWHAEPPTLNQQLATMPYNSGYDLPCEFAFLGCNIRFEPENIEDWISHSESHFGIHPPPPYAICTFCDEDPESCFQVHDDPCLNWHNRMIHISTHFQDGQNDNDMRADYWLIDYMKKIGRVHEDDYSFTHKLSERPFCDKMVPRDFETPEMKKRKDKNMRQDNNMRQEYDAEEERRHIRKLRQDRKHKISPNAQRPHKDYSAKIVQC